MATTMKIIDIHDPQAGLMELISLVSAGVEVILTDQAKPIARLVPCPLMISTQRTWMYLPRV